MNGRLFDTTMDKEARMLAAMDWLVSVSDHWDDVRDVSQSFLLKDGVLTVVTEISFNLGSSALNSTDFRKIFDCGLGDDNE
jgi:hypothetical protein